MADVVVYSSVGSLRVTNRFIFVHWVWVASNDVPGVDQARNVAEAAKGDVNEGVGSAEADFDPYCWG